MENNHQPATKRAKKQPRRSAARTSQAAAKREAERQHYQQRLRENMARLASELTAHEEAMTPHQVETLRGVIEAQQLKLAELMIDTHPEM